METFIAPIISDIILKACPSEYLPILIAALALLLAVSEYLGTTQRFKANGIVHGLKLWISKVLDNMQKPKDPPPPSDTLSNMTRGAA